MKKNKKAIITVLAVLLVVALLPFLLSSIVTLSTKSRIITAEEASSMDFDCIIVLGAGVWGNIESARPSHMLEDRLKVGIELYKMGASNKIIMSGDHGRKDYDEVNVMKEYAIENGVESSDIFMDHAGFSTYESVYRAKEIFLAEKVLIVTQEYHLYRAIYDARALGLDAYGVSANLRGYGGQTYYDFREVFARDKDFLYCLFKPKPTYLGETISVFGDGDVTND
ncbi:MAG: YdcF family protein [Clostridia bacterium]|nr:YdcF family protein [Clostridia bacterium]